MVVTQEGSNDMSQVISETKGWNSVPTDYIRSTEVPFPFQKQLYQVSLRFRPPSLLKAEEMADRNNNAVGFRMTAYSPNVFLYLFSLLFNLPIVSITTFAFMFRSFIARVWEVAPWLERANKPIPELPTLLGQFLHAYVLFVGKTAGA